MHYKPAEEDHMTRSYGKNTKDIIESGHFFGKKTGIEYFWVFWKVDHKSTHSQYRLYVVELCPESAGVERGEGNYPSDDDLHMYRCENFSCMGKAEPYVEAFRKESRRTT